MKRSILRRRTPLKRGTSRLARSRLAPVSEKRKADLQTYNAIRFRVLHNHPICQRCHAAASTDIHHQAGRGKYLLAVPFMKAVCRACHDWIHNNPKQATADGWLIPRRSMKS